MRRFSTRTRLVVIGLIAVILLAGMIIAGGPLDRDFYLSIGYRGLGYEAEDRGDPTKAIYMYNRAVHFDHDNYSAWDRLGLMYMQEKKFDSAQSAFEAAIAIDPQRYDPFAQLGSMYFHRFPELADQAFREAIPYLEQAISLNRQYIPAYEQLAKAYVKLEAFDKADEVVTKAEGSNLHSPELKSLNEKLRQDIIPINGTWEDGWTTTDASYYVRVNPTRAETLCISGLIQRRINMGKVFLSIHLEEQTLFSDSLKPSASFDFAFPLSEKSKSGRYARLKLEANPPFVPKNLGINRDDRKLGVKITRMEIKSSPGGDRAS